MFIKNIIWKLVYQYNKNKFKSLGSNTKINPTSLIQNKSQISIGHNSFIGKWCHISIVGESSLIIGKYVGISPYVKILGGDHNLSVVGKYFMTIFDGQNKPIIIEDDVMIGMDAMILKNVTIGEGSVIGARSLVTKNVLPYTIAVGNPAKMVKLRFSINDIKTHMEAIKSEHDYNFLVEKYKELGLSN